MTGHARTYLGADSRQLMRNWKKAAAAGLGMDERPGYYGQGNQILPRFLRKRTFASLLSALITRASYVAWD